MAVSSVVDDDTADDADGRGSFADAVVVDHDSGDWHGDQGGYGNDNTMCCSIRSYRRSHAPNRGKPTTHQRAKDPRRSA
jgi:hypothetical protein